MTYGLTYKGTSHHANTPPLDVEDVSVTYTNGTHALDHVSFTLQEGEQLAIVGPNGAGKSTLLKVIAGLIEPNEGRVQMFGEAPSRHVCIAYVPQRSQIDWSFPVTVADVVMMGRTKQIGLFRRPGSHDREMVAHSLERVGCAHLASQQIGSLSGGQQQRVFIARALALETDLLLMDEPMRGLDEPSQRTLQTIINSLRDDGVTVLTATHDLARAGERFDRVLLLNRQIVALGPAATVLTSDHLVQAYGGSYELAH